MQELLMKRAIAGRDYGVVTNGHIFINENVDQGAIPLTILSDTLPELDEMFRVRLTLIEVVSSNSASQFPARMGVINSTIVTIDKNDNAFGLFTVFSDNPMATSSGQKLDVLEQPQYAVDLIIERQGV